MDDLLDGCFDGCLGWFSWGGDGGGSGSGSYNTGRIGGAAAGAVIDEISDSDGARSQQRNHRGNRPRRITSTLTKYTLKLMVRKGHVSLVEDLARYGRNELRMSKCNRWGTLWIPWRWGWRSCRVITFCWPDQHQQLLRQLDEIKGANPGAIK